MSESEEANSKQSYSFTAKLFHWGFVFLFLYGVIKQVDDNSQLADINLLKFEVSFAMIFFLLLAIRFVYMRKTQSSSLPQKTDKSQKLAAKIVHVGMYFSLAAIACTGLIIGYFFSLGFKGEFLIGLMVGIHEFLVSVIYWLISVHVIAAIYHRLKNDGVWNSMVPFWKETK